MSQAVMLAGYQGARSVHTRALIALQDGLRSEPDWRLPVRLTADVTAEGRTAQSLFDEAEAEPGLIAYMASSYLTKRVCELALLDLPFAVQDRAGALARLDGPVGAALAKAVASRTGYRLLGFWDNGLRHISNRRHPLRGIRDCEGLVIRTLNNAVYQDTLRSFGFSPVVTDVRELVAAVASGAVDAQENPLTNLLTFGLHAHHRFVSLTGHLFGVALLVCRAQWFEALPSAAAAALEGAVRAATHAQRGFAAEEDDLAIAALRQEGVAIEAADAIDRAGFIAACAPILAREVDRLDPALVAAWRS